MGRRKQEISAANPLNLLSTVEVSRALGVSVTTVKRWVDDGLLPARRTAGGHRKLLLADVVRLARTENLPTADLTGLVSAKATTCDPDLAMMRAQLNTALQQLDGDLVRTLLVGAYREGVALDTLADRVIGPALFQVGHEWEMGRIDVAHEHRATQIVIAALYELEGQLRGRPRSGSPLALGGAPEHDHSIVGSLLCKLVLLESGWDAINLGPHTPLTVLAGMAERIRPRLIWVSATHLVEAESFAPEFTEFYRQAADIGAAVVIGGRVFNEALRKRIPFTVFGDGMAQLASFAKTIHPVPSRPKRGRPRMGERK